MPVQAKPQVTDSLHSALHALLLFRLTRRCYLLLFLLFCPPSTSLTLVLRASHSAILFCHCALPLLTFAFSVLPIPYLCAWNTVTTLLSILLYGSEAMTYAENYLTSAIPSSFHTSLQLHPDRSISSFVSDLRALGLSHSLVDPSLAASLITNTAYSTNIFGKQLKMDPHFNQHPMSTVKPSYTAATHAQPVTYSSRTSPKKEDLPVQSSLTFNPHGDHQSYRAAQHYPGFKPPSETAAPTTVQPSNVITTSSQMPPPGRSGRSAIRRVKFQCHLCPSTFSRKDNLKTHHRLHSVCYCVH